MENTTSALIAAIAAVVSALFAGVSAYLAYRFKREDGKAELDEWVNDPLDDDVCCLDNDNERPRLRLSDDQVWQEIIKIAGVTCSSDFQKIDKTKQREALGQLRALGASVRQLERLTGISRGIIQFAKL